MRSIATHPDSRTTLVFNIPLAEVVTDYFDQLKSRSKGYASMEYKVNAHKLMKRHELVIDRSWFQLLVTRARLQSADYLSVLRSNRRLCVRTAASVRQITGYQKNDLVLLEVKINNEPAEPLSVIVHRDAAFRVGKVRVSAWVRVCGCVCARPSHQQALCQPRTHQQQALCLDLISAQSVSSAQLSSEIMHV